MSKQGVAMRGDDFYGRQEFDCSPIEVRTGPAYLLRGDRRSRRFQQNTQIDPNLPSISEHPLS
jgi:hypothetical protein